MININSNYAYGVIATAIIIGIFAIKWGRKWLKLDSSNNSSQGVTANKTNEVVLKKPSSNSDSGSDSGSISVSTKGIGTQDRNIPAKENLINLIVLLSQKIIDNNRLWKFEGTFRVESIMIQRDNYKKIFYGIDPNSIESYNSLLNSLTDKDKDVLLATHLLKGFVRDLVETYGENSVQKLQGTALTDLLNMVMKEGVTKMNARNLGIAFPTIKSIIPTN